VHCVVEEDQIHLVSGSVIIVLELALKSFNELTSILDFFINAASINFENITELDSVISKDLFFVKARFEVAA